MSIFKNLMFWKKTKSRVAVVRLSGIIGSSGGPMRRTLSLETLDPVLKKAFSLSNIQAVALIINSPGGSPVHSQLIGQRIRQLAKEKNVPVLAFCEDVAASGGYWLAASADEIYASAASIIGSIGVISSSFGFPDALGRLGIERRVYTSGKSKSMLDPFRPENAEDVAYLKTLQSEIHELFIDYVKERRGSRLTGDEEELFSGRFWTGLRAVELGLIDRLGLANEVLLDRFGSNVELVKIKQKRGFPLFGSGAEMLIDAGLNRLEQRGIWQRFGL